MKPQDFFISARDFFAIIVPGALLLLLAPTADPALNIYSALRDGIPESATIVLLGSLVCTYAVGTVIAGVGAKADIVADNLTARIMRVYDRKDEVHALFHFFFRKIDKLRQDEALARSLELTIVPAMDKLETRRRPWSTRGFWWNYLRLNCPEAIGELDRVEGVQKQFRGLAVGAGVMSLLYSRNSGLSPWLFWSSMAFAVLIYAYWDNRMRFGRRLFELAIAHAISRRRFSEKSEAFLNRAGGWQPIVAPLSIHRQDPDHSGMR